MFLFGNIMMCFFNELTAIAQKYFPTDKADLR